MLVVKSMSDGSVSLFCMEKFLERAVCPKDQKSQAIIVFVSAANICFVGFVIFMDRFYGSNIQI